MTHEVLDHLVPDLIVAMQAIPLARGWRASLNGTAIGRHAFVVLRIHVVDLGDG
jgi:hypothetical protein